MRSLRRVTTAPLQASPNAPARVPPPYGTNAGVNAGRRFVLVVDQESFDAGRSPLFRNAVDGLLAELTPADQAMVAALPFGGVPLPFTSDKARVRLALERLTGQGSRSETGSDLACRTRRFLESLEGFLPNQGARPAPVTLVLFTAGLAAPRRDAPMGLSPGMCELPVEHFRRVATAAGAARANFYVLQPADVGFGSSPSRQTFAGAGERGSDNPLEGVEHLVGVTGATRFPLDAAGTSSLLRVAKESSAYFVAELEPVSGEVLGRSRPLAVRVSRRGVTVRARPEITLVDPPRTSTLSLTAKELLASTDAFTDLRLRTGAFTVRDADGKLRLGVVVEPAERDISLTSAGAIVVAEDGQVVSHWFAKDASERPLLGAMAVAPGTYRLRVAAIDGSRPRRRDGRNDRRRARDRRPAHAWLADARRVARRQHDAAARVRSRADRDCLLRHLRGHRGPAAFSAARTGARHRRSRRSSPCRSPSRAPATVGSSPAARCLSAPCRQATTSSAASCVSRAVRPAASFAR